MRLATIEEARTLDRRSQDEGSLSGEVLMEAAGALAAREIREFLVSRGLEKLAKTNGFIGVVCGPGGNGGDALVVARHLSSAGLQVRAYFVDVDSSRALFRKNLSLLPESVNRGSLAEADELIAGAFVGSPRKFQRPALIVDGLLGLGTSREVTGDFKTFIETMNSSDAPIVSLDLPSGLDADRGGVLGDAVCANLTLTFGVAKRGFFVNDGPKQIGRLRVLPIGFPIDLLREVASTQSAFNESLARKLLPKRSVSANKSSSGRVAIFAGRPGMIGASLIAGLGASRAGAGYVTIITNLSEKDSKSRAEIASSAPEFLTLASTDRDLWKKTEGSAAVVGPGFGVGKETLEILRELERQANHSVVVDADALTTLANEKAAGRAMPLKKSWILTPHAGELARLIGGTAKDLEADRFGSAERAAKDLGAIILFKGFRTIVSDGEKSCVILSGNPSLAKAGSGDTLSGIIAGFLAQKVPPFEAACLGAYVHGRLADEWIRSGRDVLSLQPSDLAETLPLLLKSIRSAR